MYIIDQTYFIKELNIPNLNEMDSDVLTDLNIDIDKYVRQLLRDALGAELFKDLDSNITDGVLNVDATDKWKNLVNGVEYVKDEVTYTWKGLTYTEGAFKGSLLAKFVYFYWLRDSVSLLTGTGEKNITAEGAISVNASQKLISVWNSFIEEYQFVDFDCYPSVYYKNNVPVIDYLGASVNGYVSLLTFLTDNETDYPNAPLKVYETMNQLGL